MTYEGYDVFICPVGHEYVRDCYQYDLEDCPVCGSKPKWYCSVDVTNGEDENDPSSFEPSSIVVKEWEVMTPVVHRLYGPDPNSRNPWREYKL